MDRFEFKFEIGDVVYFKTAKNDCDGRPIKLMVLERIAQECPGGIQLQYKVMGSSISAAFLEILLTKDCPPYEPNEEREADRLRMITNERELRDKYMHDMGKKHSDTTA